MVRKPLGYLHFFGKHFGITFPRDILHGLASLLGSHLESLPIKYLGFPLAGNPVEELFWSLI